MILFSIIRPNTETNANAANTVGTVSTRLIFLILSVLLLLSACKTVPWQKSADPDAKPLTTKSKPLNLEPTSPVPTAPPPSDITVLAPSPKNIATLLDQGQQGNANNTKQKFGPEDDLLGRIRAGYGMDLSSNHADVRKQRAFYLKHQDYLNKVLERGTPYMFYIVEQLDQRGMPLELAYLPIVESAFNAKAYSPSGAAGLWQFIPSTGQLFGLKQTSWYDGRRDVIASSEAALDYLEMLYKKFGDWQLALAAYNGGEGTVARALKANKTQGKGDNFWSIGLSAETTQYVPKMIAVAQILQDPTYYHASFIFIPNRPYFAVQQLNHQFDLASTALSIDTSLEELEKLNPAFKKGVSDPNGPHRLLVPINKHALLTQKLAELAARKPTPILSAKNPKKPLSASIPSSAKKTTALTLAVKSTTPVKNYRVQSGDSLYGIARRHNLNVKDLARWNALSEQGSIYPGQTIWLEASR